MTVWCLNCEQQLFAHGGVLGYDCHMTNMPLSLFAISYLFAAGSGAGLVFWLALWQLKSRLALRQGADTGLLVAGWQPANSPRAKLLPGSQQQFDRLQTDRLQTRWRQARYLQSSRFQASYSQPSWIKSGWAAALVLLCLGVLCLLLDLGKPERVLLLFVRPTASLPSIGVYALTVLLTCAAILATITNLALPLPAYSVQTIFLPLAILSAIVVMLYTGLLFVQIGFGVLAGSLLTPLLFVISSLTCGLAALVLVNLCTGKTFSPPDMLRNIARANILLLVLEIIALAIWFNLALLPENRANLIQTFASSHTQLFLATLIFCGLLAPIILETIICLHLFSVKRPPPPVVYLAAAACTLLGGFSLRVILIQLGLPTFQMALTITGV
jgi:formate-dependent nitrite reductase membrane component NrfD